MIFKLINENNKANNLQYVIIILFSGGLILCASRAAFLSLFVLMFLYLIYVVLYKKNFLTGTIVFALIITFSLSVLTIQIRPFERFKAIYYELREDNSPKTLKSASIRYQVWNASWNAIRSTLVFGAGTGDVERALKVLDALDKSR